MAKKQASLRKLILAELNAIAPASDQTVDPVTNHMTKHTNGEVFVKNLVRDAVKGNEFARSSILGYTEGKPGNANMSDNSERSKAEALDDLTRTHINNLSAKALGTQPAPDGSVPSPAQGTPATPQAPQPVASPSPIKPTSPTSKLLDLPRNRANRPQG